MASRESGFSNLIAPEIHEVFFNRYKQFPDEYAQVFNMDSSTHAYEEDVEVAGLGQFVPKAEGTDITYDDPFQSGKKRYTHATWGLGFRVTNELYNDDLYGVIKRMPNALARSAHQTIEVQAWNVFNNALNTTVQVGWDGQALLSASHGNITGAGGPYSNVLSTASDLSVTSLQQAVQIMDQTTDDRDLNLMLKAKLLVVPVPTKWMARELLHSEYKPQTADNEINSLQDEELSYLVGHYLTDIHGWYLLSAKDEHYLKFFWRQRMKLDNDDDFDSGDAKFKATMRFSVGFSGWRGIVGNSA